MATILKEAQSSQGRQRQYNFLECQLIEAIRSSLQTELFQNASFLAERLLAEVSNEEVKLLLAEAYIGKFWLFIIKKVIIKFIKHITF